MTDKDMLGTIRNIILEDKNIDLDTWDDPSYVEQGTDVEDREALTLTPAVLGAIINSPRLLALLADALKSYLDDEADD